MAKQHFDWTEYHELAKELLTRSRESCLRTAVSRAYYYTFHLARQRLFDNKFFPPSSRPKHKQVWESYSDSEDPDCRKLAEIGKRLKGKRETADYDLHFPQIEKDAPELVEIAADFAARLSAISPSLPAKPPGVVSK